MRPTDSVSLDLRFAWRSLRRRPVFLLTAVLVLGVGIGANATLWSVVDGVLLEPLPYPEPDRLVRVFDSNESFPRFPLSPANFLDFRDALGDDAHLATFLRADAELSGAGNPERLPGMRVSAGFFEVLGIAPAIGRGFGPEAEKPGNGTWTVVSDRFWRRHLDADPNAVGRTLMLDGQEHEVVGVLPSGVVHVGGSFRSLPYGTVVDIWRPGTLDPADAPRGMHFLNGLARLAPGVGLDRIRARLDATSARLAEAHPRSNEGWSVALSGLEDEIVGNTRPLVWALSGAVFLLLLVASVNVAGLILARAEARRGEISVRRALGAGSWRLARQLLTESLLLAGLGGILGAALGVGGIRALQAFGPDDFPRLGELAPDARMLTFTGALVLVAALVCALGPAFELLRRSPAVSASGSRPGLERRSARLRGSLVVLEIAAAIVLTSGAALLGASLLRLHAATPGFDSSGVVTARLSLPSARYADNEAQAAFFYRLVARIEALPGVTAAGAGSSLPWSGYDENLGFAAEGRRAENGDDDPRTRARFHLVTPGYFQALGIPLLDGRDFGPSEDSASPLRVVVSRSLAERSWPEDSAVGKRITFSRQPSEEDWIEVVGVVGDVHDGPGGQLAKVDNPGAGQVLPAIYLAYAQASWWREMAVVARAAEGQAAADPMMLVDGMRQALRELDPSLPLAQVATLGQVTGSVFQTPRFASLLVTSLAVVVVGLAAIGLSGLLAFSVSQRRREFAIRFAMGAIPKQVAARVLREAGVWTAAGSLLCLAGALASGRLWRSQLHGVESGDPALLVLAVAVLLAMALAAAAFPALRAGRIDPAESMREE
ncbi:MAG: ABC transporter permease [Holophagales bacterium]|nr:ABC transporter permease [Holophagales bacterium]